MTREWNAAYIRDASITELEETLKQIYSIVSNNKFMPITKYENDNISYLGAAEKSLICYLSPVENGWTTVWTNMRFLFQLFEINGYSGIIASGEDEFSRSNKNFWEIVIFNNGNVEDWIISNPGYRFATWTKSLEDVLYPFLVRKFNIALEKRENIIKKFIQENPAYFYKMPNYLNEVLGGKLDMMNLIRMDPFSAFPLISNECQIPYFGTEFHILDISNYLDIKRGIKPIMTYDLYYLPQEVIDYTRRPKYWYNYVEELQPLLFKIADNFSFQEIFMENLEKFVFS